MRCILLAITSLLIPGAMAQISSPLIGGPHPEYRQLYERIARSEMVITGRVVKAELAGLRVLHLGPPEGGGVRSTTVEEGRGGWHYTIEVEETPCSQADSTVNPTRMTVGTPVHLFVRGERSWHSDLYPGQYTGPEVLADGKKYLVYLFRHPRQKELTDTYKLPEGVVYYRAFDHDMGVYELPVTKDSGSKPSRATRLLSTLTTFCEAVRPTDVSVKLQRLRALRDQAEPSWRDSVETAIRALEEIEPGRK